MKFHHAVLLTVAVALGADTAAAQLQTNITRMHLQPEEAAVWAVIDKEWGRSGCCGRENLMTNLRYLDLVADDAIVWFWGQPAPMSKESMRTSDGALEMPGSPWATTRVAYELYPEGLVIHGNTAVAHYRCRVVTVDKNNKLETSDCRFTDTLVRDRPGAQWQFLSWVGGNLSKQN